MSLSAILLTCFFTVIGLILRSDARTTPVPKPTPSTPGQVSWYPNDGMQWTPMGFFGGASVPPPRQPQDSGPFEPANQGRHMEPVSLPPHYENGMNQYYGGVSWVPVYQPGPQTRHPQFGGMNEYNPNMFTTPRTHRRTKRRATQGPNVSA